MGKSRLLFNFSHFLLLAENAIWSSNELIVSSPCSRHGNQKTEQVANTEREKDRKKERKKMAQKQCTIPMNDNYAPQGPKRA